MSDRCRAAACAGGNPSSRAPENLVFVSSTGQSGNPLSSYYEYYAEPWRDGEYLPMLTDRSRVEDDALGTLVLSPK